MRSPLEVRTHKSRLAMWPMRYGSAARWALLILLSLAVVLPARAQEEATPKILEGKPAVLAVVDFQDLSGYEGEWNPGQGLAVELINALIERDVTVVHFTEATMTEMGRSHSDLADPAFQKEIGKMLSADYLFYGAVTAFQVDVKKGGIGGFGASLTTITEEVEGHLVDVETATAGTPVSVREKKKKVGLIIKKDDFKLEPLGIPDVAELTSKVIDQVADQVKAGLPRVEWTAKIGTTGGRLYIKDGESSGIEVGMTFVVKCEEEIIDDDTGEVLDHNEYELGIVRATEVKPKITYVEAVDDADIDPSGEDCYVKQYLPEPEEPLGDTSGS